MMLNIRGLSVDDTNDTQRESIIRFRQPHIVTTKEESRVAELP